MKTQSAYSARIVLKVDEFYADNAEEAEKIIDSMITLLATASESTMPEVTWQEVDFDLIPEATNS